MLSDNSVIKLRKSPRKSTEVGKWYSDSQKIEAVKLWLVTGNLKVVAATLDIPYVTVRDWRYTNWWSELTSEIRTEGSFQLSNKLKKAAERALEVSVERLENGDWIMNQKTGEMVRKQVSMRDAVLMSTQFLDRQKQLEQRPIDEANNQKIQDRLASLADAFARFAGGKVIDAVYDERPEGLQEGVQLGEDQSTPQIEGPGGEDTSPEECGEEDGESTYFDASGSQETNYRGGNEQP